MFGMPLREGDETTLAEQTKEGRRRRRCQTDETRTSGIGGSTRLTHARLDRPDDWFPNHETIPLRDCLRRPIQSTGVCLPPKDSVGGGDEEQGGGTEEDACDDHGLLNLFLLLVLVLVRCSGSGAASMLCSNAGRGRDGTKVSRWSRGQWREGALVGLEA